MTVGFLQWVLEGFTAPRATVRALLDAKHGPEVAGMLFALGYLVESVFVVLLGPNGGAGMVAHVSGVITHAFVFAIISMLVYRLGRLAGGTGSFVETVLAVSWYMFMGSLMSPIIVLALGQAVVDSDALAGGATPPQIDSGIQILVLLVGMISVWLFSNGVAALHGFKNIWGVVGVVVGFPVAAVLLVTLLTGGVPQ